MRQQEIIIEFDPERPEHNNEKSVEYIFNKYHKELGFPNVLKVQIRFPDIIALDKNGEKINIELEYESKGFKKHLEQIDPNERYLVICWRNSPNYSCPVDVLTLKDKVKIHKPPKKYISGGDEPRFIILSYNPIKAGRPFREWKNVNIFRAKHKLGKNILPPDSIVVIYEKGLIVGEMRVVRHIIIDEPTSNKMLNLYYDLVNYPITLYSFDTMQERQDRDWIKHHIIYDNFIEYFPPIRYNEIKKWIGKKMTRSGYLKIDFDIYQKIRGYK